MNRDPMAGWSQVSRMLVRQRGDRGAALVELAVVLPLLVLIVVGTVDFAQVFYYAIELTDAARAGSQYAASLPTRPNDSAGITAAAQGAAPNISGMAVSLNTPLPPVCLCATDDGTTFSGAVSCTSACTSPQHLIQTVTVSVSATFSFFSPFPGVPNNITMTRTATTRVPF